jgi:hypothetical protein
MTRQDSTYEFSPVPVRRAHRPARAIFAVVPGQTESRLKMRIAVFNEDAARSPWQNSHVERLIRSFVANASDYIIGFELGALAPCPETPPVCITTKLAPIIAGYGAVQFLAPNRFSAQTDSTDRLAVAAANNAVQAHSRRYPC